MSNSLKVLARDLVTELNTGTSDTPVWVEINGINSIGITWNGNNADTTTFENGGWMTHLKASRGATLSFQGLMIEDESDGTRDAGQAAAEAWALEIGQSSIKQIRITTPGGTTGVFDASATAPIGLGTGGGNDDPNGWNLDVEMSGEPTISTLGAAPDTPGTPTGVEGNDLVTLTWTGSAGTGGHFEVVSVKSSDDSEISRITSTSPYTFGGLASAAAYKFKVRAVSATGRKSAFTVLSSEYTTT